MNGSLVIFVLVFYGSVLFCLGVFLFLALILLREALRRCRERRVIDGCGARM